MGLAVGCATNSSRGRLDQLLAAASLDTRFQVTVASDEVAAPKPDPDVYREAMRRLGVAADKTVVIEDSPVGIKAGLGAGCEVIAVDRGVFDPGLLGGAHHIVASLE
jgi:HAD superfamily hydrolase (TIGR01509 family)